MKFLALTFFFINTNLLAKDLPDHAIYGDDDRVEAINVLQPDWLKNAVPSVVAMIEKKKLKKKCIFSRGNKKVYAFKKVKTLEEWGLCSDEAFADQLQGAECSGFLVAPNIVVTAGHCVPTEKVCKKNLWVFDYLVDSSGKIPDTFSTSQVYECKRIIKREKVNSSFVDFALIELDRPVTDRKPLAMNKLGGVHEQMSLALVGFPIGAPMKVVGNGVVTETLNLAFFTNLDSFSGNSGSPVFNSTTGLVEGILIGGSRDFDDTGVCRRYHFCTETSCFGEMVMSVQPFLPYLP